MWDTFLYRGAFALSLVPGVFGLSAMIQPEITLKMVEFPIPTEPQSRKLALSFWRLHGTRNLVISYLLVNNALTGDRRLMGMGLIGTVFIVLVDGFVSRSLIGGKEWFHWGYIPVYVAFIGGLLYSE
ncbi:Ff.00g080920.m01.CDS01 [Fusarium sp. VM40]|nr:Ff.00g080920.m01.CDS01 [Fusarium sp. VM40]